jgi:glyoxylase-like metal-dependent hydrolase (beta-lactamase superfamily II)
MVLVWPTHAARAPPESPTMTQAFPAVRTALNRLTLATSIAAMSAALPLAAAGLFALGTPAQAAAPQQKVQAPGWYRFMVGSVEVTALNDGTVNLPVDKLLHAPKGKVAAELKKVHLSAPLESSVNGFLINTGSRLVLVDAGAGGLFGPTLGKLAAQLRSAGYQPEQVDDIVITHMHPDHVGGLAPEGKAVFPNATVHADKADADHWLSAASLEAAPADKKGYFQGAMASLKPYADAGKFKTFSQDGELVPGLRAVATHGHTPGHAVYVVESGGQRLVLIGDLIHVGAVQLASPHITIGFDSDAKQARAQRLKLFKQLAQDGSLVAAAHLPFPAVGRLRAVGQGYAWVPLNYSSMVK